MKWVRTSLCLLALPLASAPAAEAGSLPLGGARLVIGGRIEAGYGTDDAGDFNYARSGYSPQRLFRLGLSTELRATRRLALLADLRSDNVERPGLRALYVRWRALERPGLDLQLGRVPPVVGSFARRYGSDGNPLIGTPLPYQYATTLREDRLPYGPNALLQQRGYGGYYSYDSSYGAGSANTNVGLPLVEGDDWDTGLQARLSHGNLELALAATRGSASDPVVRENNSGRQWSGRVQWRPIFGLALGVSASRGAYLARQAGARFRPPQPQAEDAHQSLWAADAEFAAGHTLLRGEALLSRWEAPTARPDRPLLAWGLLLEARQILRPGLYAALRAEGVFFDRLQGSQLANTWDAGVMRLEGGLGYALRRDLRLKASYQHNWRDAGPSRSGGLVAAKATFSF